MSAVSFLVSLDDKISPGVNSAVGSLADLDASLKKDQASLRTMESALKRLQNTEGASQERIDSLSAAIDQKKAKIGETTNSIADYSAGNQGAAESTGILGDKIAAMGGPVGIAIAVFTALAAAVVAVGAVLIKTALASASAYRNQLLLNTAMSGSAEVGKAMTDATYRVSREVALSGDAVQKLAGSLSKAGLSGSVFERSLKNLASVASVAGEDAVGPIKEVIERSQQLGSLKLEPDQLKGTGLQIADIYSQLSKDLGLSIEDVQKQLKDGKIKASDGISALNKVMEQKFSGLAGKKLLDFDTQISKAKEGFVGMFRDVNIEPFLAGLHSVLGLLDEGSATGKVLKSVLTGAMNGFFAAAGAALPYVKEFLLQLGIAALKLYIGIKPAVKALGEVLGFDDTSSADAMSAIKKVAETIVTGLAIAITVIGAVVGAVVLLAQWFWNVGSAAASVVGAIGSVGASIAGAFSSAISYIAGLDFAGIARNLISGLVAGIQSGTGLVIAAISGLGSSAIGALKSTLGIASPSKVFAGLGDFTAQGFAGGVDQAAPMVADSMNAMVEMPSIPAPTIPAPTTNGAPAPSGAGGSFTIESIVIHLGGNANANDGASIKEAVVDALREAAEEMGFPSPAVAA